MTTKAYGASGDAGATTAGTYTFTVPAGVSSIVAKAWGAGGGNASAGGESGVSTAGPTWKVRAGGGGKGTTTAGDRVGGSVLVGTGYPGGNGATGGGGGGAGPSSAGGNGSGDSGGAAGTGGFAGAGGNGAVFKGDAGSDGAAAGGGGGAKSVAAGGGGGGAFATATFAVTAGDTLTIIVGAGSPSGTFWAGGMGRVQLDYTVDLTANESGSLSVGALLGTADVAQGPPPWLWGAVSTDDTIAFNETGTLAVAAGVSGAESWTIAYNEVGSLDGSSSLSGVDTMAFGFNEVGSLDGSSSLSGVDTLALTNSGVLHSVTAANGVSSVSGFIWPTDLSWPAVFSAGGIQKPHQGGIAKHTVGAARPARRTTG